MKVLIAEDELLERKVMKEFINSNFNDIKVIGEATNGRIAIQLAEKLKPDIICMDIKMPGINGLEAIEKIHAINPKIKFILVSAYNTFDYAKEAMKYGIKDYILKPAKTEEIVRSLLRIQKEVMYERSIASQKERSSKLIKDGLLRNVMESPVDEETNSLMDKLYPTAKTSYFLVFSATEEKAFQKIYATLEKHIEHPFIVTVMREAVIVLIILSAKIQKSEQLIFVRKLSIHAGEDIYIGIGSLCDKFTRLPESYQKAYKACFQIKVDKRSNYSYFQENKGEVGHTNVVQYILENVEQGRREEVLRYFTENYYYFSAVDKEKLYISIQNSLMKRYLSEPPTSLIALKTKKDWQAHLHICCMKINEHYQSKQLMTQAREYIKVNYHKQLTLEEVANIVRLSPNYFSNMFKEEFGTTFIELLTKVRMEKARELIEGNSNSLKEICFLIGYKDPNYFSRVFKKYYNLSPKQFQRDIFKSK